MKAHFFLTAIVALALNTQTISADNVANFSLGKTEVDITTTEQKMFYINIGQNDGTENIEFTIQNDANQAIFDETLTGANTYARRYDLTQLAIGEYTVVVKKGNLKIVHNIRVHRKGISLGEKPNRMYFSPSVNQTANLVKVQMTLDQTDHIKVVIMDANFRAVLNEKYRNVSTLSKIYNMAELPAGKYTLLIYAQGKVHTETITVAPPQVP